VRAITFDIRLARIAAAKSLGTLSPRAYVSGLGPTRCERVSDQTLPGRDWLIVEPCMAGICGSDVMQVFLEAASDNPLSAVVSSPHVMGHEVVGVVVEAGKEVKRFARGDRVVVSPWLPCAPRGLPPCDACRVGRFPLCSRFFDGQLAKGMHLGNCRDVGGGFAEAMALHESMLYPVPEGVDLDDAVLADPFSVALHAVLRAPPEPGETVLVYGCGSLGLLALQILAVLFPGVNVLAVDHKPRLQGLVTRLGARRLFTSRGKDLVGEIADHLGAPLRRPFRGLPWIQSGVDKVYDTVGSSQSLEIGLRIARPRASIVVVGVSLPRRFEWTPLYFKEVALLGSNAYGIESVGGTRKHAIEIFLELLRDRRITLDGLVTHRYPLERFGDAFMAVYDKRKSGAIKVLFDPKLDPAGGSSGSAGAMA
jgi:threonine dehydrogenase-like Zn-dependent dehydrogenase